MRSLVLAAVLGVALAPFVRPQTYWATGPAPIERLTPSDSPVLYIWMDGESFRNLKNYQATNANIFVDSRTVPIYGWHTPLGALAENLGHRTNLEYGTVLVRVVLDKPEIVRSLDYQPAKVAKGEMVYHDYAIPRIMQFHEWIFSSENVKEWSAFTEEVTQALAADLARYRSGLIDRNDTHFYGSRFDRLGTIRAGAKILARMRKNQPVRRVRPMSANPVCEQMFTTQF
jgi:hypothetical protein